MYADAMELKANDSNFRFELRALGLLTRSTDGGTIEEPVLSLEVIH